MLELVPVHPLSVALTLALATALVALPRRWAMLPVLIAAILIPADQRVIVATLDFTCIRILILVTVLRLVARGEIQSFRFHKLDGMVLSLILTLLIAGTVLHQTSEAFVYRLGNAFDGLGMYFSSRILLRSWRDVRTMTLGGLVSLGLFAAFMGVEWATGRNFFSAIGSVPEYTLVRNGRLRCQGAFAHPILAGVFAATWAPILASLWWSRQRNLAPIGVFFCLLIAVFSSSSTPLVALAVGFATLSLWPVRRNLNVIRWLGIGLLIALHFVREKPVWHLLARINVLGGSTGYHRFWIIDRTIEYFSEWWLIGTRDISHWNIHWNDITNQYVGSAINGGVIALVCLVGVFVVGFTGMGRVAKNRASRPDERRLAWGLGCMLAVHAAAFVAVSYFGQMTFIWYQQLAMVGTVIEITRQRERVMYRVTAVPVPAVA